MSGSAEVASGTLHDRHVGSGNFCFAICLSGRIRDEGDQPYAPRRKTFFYATNDDPYDLVDGHAMPGTGTDCFRSVIELNTVRAINPVQDTHNHAATTTGVLLKALEAHAAAARKDEPKPYAAQAAVLGKPNPEMLQFVMEKHGLDATRTLFVGDRLDTDIWMGNRAGVDSCFVLTGVHGEEDLDTVLVPSSGRSSEPRQKVRPTVVLKSFGDLRQAAEELLAQRSPAVRAAQADLSGAGAGTKGSDPSDDASSVSRL